MNPQNIRNEQAAFQVLMPVPVPPVDELLQPVRDPPLLPLGENNGNEQVVLIGPQPAAPVGRVRGQGRRGRPRGRAIARRPRGRGRSHINENPVNFPLVEDLFELDERREMLNEILDFQLNHPDLARIQDQLNVEEARRLQDQQINVEEAGRLDVQQMNVVGARRLVIQENEIRDNNFIDVEIEIVNMCIVCVSRACNRRLDCCIHEFCEECVAALRGMNPPNVCPLCRALFVRTNPI